MHELLMYHLILQNALSSTVATRQKHSWEYANRIDHLLAIERELRALLDMRLAPFGVTYAQRCVLEFIRAPQNWRGQPIEGPIRPADVAEHFGFAPRTVTEALNRISEYVERGVHPEDRRAVVLTLSKKGLMALESTRQIVGATQRDLFGDMSRSQDLAFWNELPALRNRIDRARKREALRARKA